MVIYILGYNYVKGSGPIKNYAIDIINILIAIALILLNEKKEIIKEAIPKDNDFNETK